MTSKIFIVLCLMTSVMVVANGASAPVSAQECQASYKAKDYTRAQRSCTAIAESGNKEAQYLLGRMYEEGQGVVVDPIAAVKWYRRAAESGHATSQRRLAGAYYQGRGVNKNDAMARRWLEIAAKNGDARAQKQLAVGYEMGIGGLPQDKKLAQQWRERAEQGSEKDAR